MNKIITLKQAINLSKELKSEGKTVVLAGGCFDIPHKGHLTYLKNAKRQGDVLFVALESDSNVKRLKGEGRPINTQKDRAFKLTSFPFVNYVILLVPFTSDEQYFAMTESLLPHVIGITEDDPKKKEKQLQAKAVGGRVVTVTKRLPEHSTTKLINHA